MTGLFAFSATSLEAAPGPVTIVLTNNSVLTHNIAIKGNGVDLKGLEVGMGGQSTVTGDLVAGTYTFYCSVAGHEAAGMSGTLTVTTTPTGGGGDPIPDPSTSLDGLTLVKANCGGCHTLAAAATTGRVGPNLDDKHPDYDKVMTKTWEGDDPMPSFRNILTFQQRSAVAKFVAQSVGRWESGDDRDYDGP